ncbi:hypothetical protein GCM10026987_00160 [Belliella aquatica]|uniref:Uncharacterized protein n=1 Tax=Belliella aquatica TaxID=1323734 RepID=A0ABQ1N2Z8_9BACT|nr:hypothetical protein GCM10010993_32670 [Belliella aquatica]
MGADKKRISVDLSNQRHQCANRPEMTLIEQISMGDKNQIDFQIFQSATADELLKLLDMLFFP